ncbi:MAG: pimeloyl-ACP methyl ester esterase BioH [Arenimonas sp.]
MHIEVRGSGPALVMLHGWAMHAGIFAPLSERLESHFTLHLVDLPGHGHSADSGVTLELGSVAEAVIARTPPALWLGWSLGGLIALHAARHFPAAVHGLLMVCASPRFVRSEDWPHGVEDDVFAGFERELADDYRGTIDRFLLLEAQGAERMRDQIRLLRAQVFAHGEPSRQGLLDGLRLLREADLRAELPRLQMPSAWLASRRDRLVRPAAMHAAAALCGSAHYRCLEHAGHAPFLTDPEAVASEINALAQALPA